jgi:hypothetical protein
MLNNVINYYSNVSNMAIVNLKAEKAFQFRKHLTNQSLLRATQSHYEGISNSDEAKKLIKQYTDSMRGMTDIAKNDYNKTLKMLKATNDPIAKQRILDQYAERGIHGFTAKNGAKWNIETYSNMCTTQFNNELVRLSIRESLEDGSKVLISSHSGACSLCVPYQGKILSLVELDKAKSNGLFHVRCKHFYSEVKSNDKNTD